MAYIKLCALEEMDPQIQGKAKEILEKTGKLFSFPSRRGELEKMMQENVDAIKEAGYSEAQILEAVAITGYFNYINTLSNVFGLGK